MRDYKWIIVQVGEKKEFRCGYVYWHKDLLKEGEDKTCVVGGGLVDLDKYTNTIHLFGRSTDFGWVYDLSIMQSCKESMVEAFKQLCKEREIEGIDVETCMIEWRNCLWDKYVLKEKS
jgi:hypothetical protein